MKKGTFLIVVGLIGLMLGIASMAAGQDELACVNTWGYWKNHSIYGAHPIRAGTPSVKIPSSSATGKTRRPIRTTSRGTRSC